MAFARTDLKEVSERLFTWRSIIRDAIMWHKNIVMHDSSTTTSENLATWQVSRVGLQVAYQDIG